MKDTLIKLRSLNDASRAMNARLNMDDFLASVESTASGTLGLPAFCLLSMEGSPSRLVAKRWKGFEDGAMGRIAIDFSEGIYAQARASGKTRIAPGPRALGLPEPNPGGTALIAPLLNESGESGFMIGLSGSEYSFDEDDIEIFSVFSAQVAVAHRNVLLHQEALKMNKELASLARVGAALNAFTDPDELLKEILVAAQWVLGYGQCAILLPDQEKSFLVIREAYGSDEFFTSGYKFPVGSGIIGSAYRDKAIILVKDAASDPRYIKDLGATVSEMACPLVIQGESIGVIDAESTDKSFNENDLELFSAFAQQVATALHNADLVSRLGFSNERLEANVEDIKRMNEELREYSHRLASSNEFLEKRIRELQTLYEAGKAITSSLNLEDTLSAIMSMVNDIISVSSGAIMLLDEETSEMKERMRFDFPHDRIRDGGDAEFDIPLTIGERTIGTFKVSSTALSGISEGDKRILQTIASQAAIAIENARLFESTQNAYFDTISSLARAIETRDPYTKGHSDRVTSYAMELAAFIGLSEKEINVIQYAGLLHDIGKIGISDAILNKRTGLDALDLGFIREHPLLGDAILSPLRFLQDAQSVVKYHHERWDGTGYPEKLRGEGIPLPARIIAIADAYDAMTTDRPYRGAMSREEALSELEKGRGGQFDPRLADAFIAMVKKGGPRA